MRHVRPSLIYPCDEHEDQTRTHPAREESEARRPWLSSRDRGFLWARCNPCVEDRGWNHPERGCRRVRAPALDLGVRGPSKISARPSGDPGVHPGAWSQNRGDEPGHHRLSSRRRDRLSRGGSVSSMSVLGESGSMERGGASGAVAGRWWVRGHGVRDEVSSVRMMGDATASRALLVNRRTTRQSDRI